MGRFIVVLALLACALVPARVRAQGFAYTLDELRCRESLSREGQRLARSLSKAITDCHLLRAAGKVVPATDCNAAGEADLKNRAAEAEQRLRERVLSRCSDVEPGLLMYGSCPAPCDGAVGSIDDFADVADCTVCLITAQLEGLGADAQGSPAPPLQGDERSCHRTIGKRQGQHLHKLMRNRSQCQRRAERGGEVDTQDCAISDVGSKIAKARMKAFTSIVDACGGANLSVVDSCSAADAASLANCVLAGSDATGQTLFESFYGLGAPVASTTTSTTSTSTTSTSTTLVQDPQCPDVVERVLLGGTSNSCASNGDCAAGVCDATLGRCVTLTNLDNGWTGIAHGLDFNDGVFTLTDVVCPGPFDGGAAEPCGECKVLRSRSETNACRCNTNSRVICNDPFASSDPASCGTGLTCSTNADCSRCQITTSIVCGQDSDCPTGELCMSGLRAPACTGGQCIGACNCYLGPPLPLSSGNTPACIVQQLRDDVSGTVNVDSGASSVLTQVAAIIHLGETITIPCPYCNGDVVAGDLVRDGVCIGGSNAGQSCDVDASNWTFPAPGGDGHSLDCFPLVGKNISGAGLRIDTRATTGTVSLDSQVECGFSFAPELCPCAGCSGAPQIPCGSNADCVGNGECRKLGQGNPRQNDCTDDLCSDVGGGKGECTTGPDSKYCDGVLRANGEGFVSCSTNGDCDQADCGTVSCGACTRVERRKCFLPMIEASGLADPSEPTTVAIYCIPPTGNPGTNSVAGLPGAGVAITQTTSRAFCASAPGTEYVPGAGGCP